MVFEVSLVFILDLHRGYICDVYTLSCCPIGSQPVPEKRGYYKDRRTGADGKSIHHHLRTQ